jgi:lipopolysaccharide export system protein LptA
VWTPRRVLLLLLGVVLFGTAFGVYARLLGWIDGLPQLPTEFLAKREPGEIDLPPATTKLTDAKLRKAFPAPCSEVEWKINIELKARGIVFAANDYSIADGRLTLRPFSLATFKDRGRDEYPEINTVHSDVAVLEFDKPIKSLNDAKDHRLVGVTLVADEKAQTYDPRRGRVHFSNNRGTPSRDDDLELVTPGPVYFRELPEKTPPLEQAPPQIRTEAVVSLTDRQSRPEPTTVTAQGMRVYLTNERSAPASGGAKVKDKHAPAVTGVRRVVLPRNVDMNLWMPPGSGFLESAKSKPATQPTTQAAAGKPAEPTNVQIKTHGPFTYDIMADADRARFDRLPAAAGTLPDFVRVVRPQTRGPGSVVCDQLECDHLEIQFARRPATAKDVPTALGKGPTKATGPGQGASVEWVHAWGAGQSVVLTSDDERLEARGNDLFHDARTKRTTLTGVPEMVAAKDTHEIHAPELVLYGADSAEGQQAQARGPGYLRLNDKDRRGLAKWKQMLVYRKEDLTERITLTGEASFDEMPHADRPQTAGVQSIRGDQIKLVLLADPPADQKASATKSLQSAANAAPGELPRRKPKSLEVDGHVVARTAELNITDTDHLVMLFTEAPAAAAPAPQPAGPSGAADAKPQAAPPPPAAKPTNGPPKKPIEVRAGKVQLLVQRQGDVNQLDSVLCEGNVRVHQDPATPQDKPIDIIGRTLSLKHTREGNILDVLGTLQEEARVSFPELSLFGPRVHIDQIDNVADVEGIGGMTLESQTDFEGKKLERPAPLLITWKQAMHFDGLLASFYGNVEATQNSTSLLCHTMRVRLTRPISLAQVSADRKPGHAPPAVETVVCGKDSAPTAPDVTITQSETDARGRLVKYQRIEANEVDIDKVEGKLQAPSRGQVWLLQLGPKGQPGQLPGPLAATAAKPSQTAPVEEEHKLTWVRFTGSLSANSPARTVKFWAAKGDFVDVLHMPHDNPGLNLKMDHLIAKLPQGALHLRCQLLTIYTSKTPDGKQFQTMEATGKAFVNWQNEFHGWADKISFDESKQQMILKGTDDNLATVQKFGAAGGTPGMSAAKTFIYNRLNGSWWQDNVKILNTGPIGGK